jgi:penicillin amidase
MRIVAFIISMAISIGLFYFLEFPQKMGDKNLPRIAPFLSPFTGYSVQAKQAEAKRNDETQKIDGIKEAVSIHYDDHQVPHISANSNWDLYFAQGYATAKDRLWQMDFISYASAGRLSEIVGTATLEFDQMQRRLGLPQAAKENIDFFKSDEGSMEVINAYSAGVNAYINSLKPRDYPIEYKLLDYAPETWTPEKSALLIKYMAKMLTSREHDFELTNAIDKFGKELFETLYPTFPPAKDNDPVIPLSYTDSVRIIKGDTLRTTIFEEKYASHELEKDPPYLGSNNWAVDGAHSASGSPILCNDPHLRLQVPSIWYQTQLISPEVNVYGVTIPGAPGIIIGFNENIAWGVTNGAMDVKDWYKVVFKDDTREEYNLGGVWKKTEKRIEEIKIKGQESLFDTILYTELGPITYDRNFSKSENKSPMALRWVALDHGNEMKAFYLLNRAKGYEDYKEALKHYNCPEQNFVFASKNGDIALWQRGKIPIRRKDQGKFVQEAADPNSKWAGFIPAEDMPHVLNPERGFVSSANQHATDSTYPYNYHGIYQFYRNRRINDVLGSKEKFRIADMMQLQSDNYNLLGEEVLKWTLPYMDSIGAGKDSEVFKLLADWDFFNNPDSKGAIAFELFWNELHTLTWDEFLGEKSGFVAPNFYYTNRFLQKQPGNYLVENKSENINNVEELLTKALANADKAYTEVESDKKQDWSHYKSTQAQHWARIAPFYSQKLLNGGNKHIVNATSSTHGPSWRMIVHLKEETEAYGIFPGGQSGNPASKHYDNYSPLWEKGEYLSLKFVTKPEHFEAWDFTTLNFFPAD